VRALVAARRDVATARRKNREKKLFFALQRPRARARPFTEYIDAAGFSQEKGARRLLLIIKEISDRFSLG